MGQSNELHSSGLNYDFSYQHNLIRHTGPFLSRSTQESGLFQKDKKEETKEYKSRKVQAAADACE